MTTLGSSKRQRRWQRRPLLPAVLMLVLMVACSSQTGARTDGGASADTSANDLVHLDVGLGYIPSVQFAQFYFAQQAGYYEAAGLDVTFQNEIDPDLIVLVGQGAYDIGIGDGTSVIPAVSQGVPIRYVATIYGNLPNVVFARVDAGIRTAGDLKGRSVGTPWRGGSNWIMLQALLQSAGLSTADIVVAARP